MNTVIRRSFCLVLCLLVAVSSALADVPRLIHYQGKLLDTVGAPVSGDVSLTIRLYDGPAPGGSVTFEESHTSVPLKNGLFSILIGTSTAAGVPDAAFASATAYLGVSVQGGEELSPRTRLVSVPYALRANRAATAERLVKPGTAESAVLKSEVLIDNLLALTSEENREQIEGALSGLSTLVRDNSGDVREMIAELRDLSTSLKLASDEFRTVLEDNRGDLKSAVANLNEATAELKPMVDYLGDEDTVRKLDSLIHNGSELALRLNTLVGDNQYSLDQTLLDLRESFSINYY